MLACMYKMLTTCLILFSKTTDALTGALVAKWAFCMLSCSVTCIFLYLVIFLSQLLPNNLHLALAESTTQQPSLSQLCNKQVDVWRYVANGTRN